MSLISMHYDHKPCPVCKSPVEWAEDASSRLIVTSPVCGMFAIDKVTESQLRYVVRENDGLVYKISFSLRTAYEGLRRTKDNSLLRTGSLDDFKRIIKQPDLPVLEKLHILLRYLVSGFSLSTDAHNETGRYATGSR